MMRYDEAALDKLREQQKVSDVLLRLGVKIRKSGREWVGLSPFNSERTPSFTVNDEKGFYKCFSSGAQGDVIDAVMSLTGRSFPEAVDWLGGVQELSPEERARIEQKRREETAREKAERERLMSEAERAFERAVPVYGTPVEAYLRKRGLEPDPSWAFDLRFLEIPYKGFPDPHSEVGELLGRFPAMIAAIRNVSGKLIGIHRTYIDPETFGKLRVGDARRNAAKKVFGEVTGGMIRLSPPGLRLAIGEGIETSRSWRLLNPDEDTSVAAGVSLGNIAGSATAHVDHPTAEGKKIPNGEPDMARPGLELPPDVLEVILLGDGDSEPVNTRCNILVAGRRFRAQGRGVGVDFAPRGKDFSDVWMEACAS